jgi:peptide/nickel transport system ATP-binding protein
VLPKVLTPVPAGQGAPLLDVRDLRVRFHLKAPLFSRGAASRSSSRTPSPH